MKNRLIFLLGFMVPLIVFGFIVDDEPLKKILSQLDKFRVEYPQEKVHLHLDKPYYAIGDQIWLKAYVVNGENNHLSNLSKVIYVELINEKDSIKQSLMLPLKAGLAYGDFNLSDSLREGNYRIRAYTTWMRNFGEDYFFDKTIIIGNVISNNIVTDISYTFSKVNTNQQKVVGTIQYSYLDGKPVANKEVNYDVQLDFRNISKGKGTTDAKGQLTITFINTQPFILKSGKIATTVKLSDTQFVNKSFPVKSTSTDVDVKFFPEGGELVAGVQSKVGFKALRADGTGINISGYITDQSNNQIVKFQSQHAGMGVFPFQPTINQTYTANIIFDDGSVKIIPLPRITPYGYVLTVDNSDVNKIVVKVTASLSTPVNGELFLIAQSNGVVHYVSKNKIEPQVFIVEIPKKRFPTGILQLTLFSDLYEPVAERLVFINHSDHLKINVISDKTSYVKREKVKLSVEVRDAQDKPVVGSFSLSVLHGNSVPFAEDDVVTIQSNLLLTSDIKGYIESPNYYFTDINQEKLNHLDNLLLTQGWRRFNWKSLLANSYPPINYYPEYSMAINGHLKTSNGKPVIGGKVSLLSTAGDVLLMDTVTDATGYFNFDDLYFHDGTKFVINAKNVNGRKNVDIELNQVPATIVTKNKNAAEIKININRSLISYLKNSRDQFESLARFNPNRNTIMLAEVKVVEKKILAKNSSNLNGPGNADAIITSDQLKNCLNLAQCLQGRIAGVVIQNGIAYSTRNLASFRGPIPMQIIIDGVYVNPEYLSVINPIDVDAIEVLKNGGNTAIYGLRGEGGLLIITTKRGERNLNASRYAAGIVNYNPKGYYKTREFYSPNYNDPKINTEIPDLRSTIFWKPNIITDSNGKASVEFFNADGIGNYIITIEGLNLDGKLGRQSVKYSVQ